MRAFLLAVLVLLAVAGCESKQAVSVPRAAERLPAAGVGTHTVRRGESLVTIANLYKVSAGSLMQANNLKDMRSIYVGQVLVIPGKAALPGVGATPDLSNIVSESYFTWPIRGRVVRGFEAGGSDSEHRRGIVIEARTGEPVLAAMSGVVTFTSDAFQGYGKTILIRHANNLSTFYAYNSRILVGVGATVRQGQPIAEAGQSGRATSPQLFFKILYGEEPLNPLMYLR